MGEVTEPNKMTLWVERSWLKHEPVGSVQEVLVGTKLGEATERNKLITNSLN